MRQIKLAPVDNGGGSGGQTQSPAAAQPAQTQAAPSTITGGTSKADAKPFEDGFGVPAKPQWTETPEPASAVTEAPGAPGNAAGTEHTEASTPAENGDTTTEPAQPAGDALPGDDVLTELGKFALGQPTTTTAATTPAEKPGEAPAVLDDAGIAKRIDPDGNATPEVKLQNAIKFAKESQTFAGRLTTQVGQYRAALKQITPYFSLNENGDVTDVNLVGLAERLGNERVNEQLAKSGVKLVPLDYQPGATTDEDAVMVAAADAMIPGKELDFEEKLAELQGSPKKWLAFMDKVNEAKLANRIKNERVDASRAIQTEREREAMKGKIGALFGELKKHPDYASDIKPAIDHFNNEVIPHDKPLLGEARLNVLHRLAMFNRMPKVLKSVRDEAFALGKRAALEQLGLAQPNGEVPTIVDSSARQRGQGGDSTAPVAVTKALAAALT